MRLHEFGRIAGASQLAVASVRANVMGDLHVPSSPGRTWRRGPYGGDGTRRHAQTAIAAVSV